MQGQPTLHLTQARSLAMTGALRQAISLLQYSNAELSTHLASLAETNPCLVIRPSVVSILAWISERPILPWTQQNDGASGAGASGADVAARSSSGLVGHVMEQVPFLICFASDLPIAEAFVAALDANGWLDCSVADVAKGIGCGIDRAEAVLKLLQRAEPAGLFSRDLSECLRLQAVEMGVLDPDFDKLLDNLPLLAAGDLAAVAAHLCCNTDRVAEMLRTIRRMNPKPGAVFEVDFVPITEPDIIVRQSKGRWTVELNRSNLAAVEVGEGGAAKDDLRDARWLVRAVARRNATTLRIARALVAHQTGFVQDGVAHLRPLTLADISAQTELHISTISRVTNGLMVALPRATVPLRDFFGRAMADESGPTTASVRHDLGRLVAAENPKAPLSDLQIQAFFAKKGIILARRTVAKYRQVMRIPCSVARLRKARLDA